MSNFSFDCPFCEKEIQSEFQQVGLVVACPTCGESFHVPPPRKTGLIASLFKNLGKISGTIATPYWFWLGEFGGKLTTGNLVKALAADGIEVPKATGYFGQGAGQYLIQVTCEIESLNKLLSGSVLTQTGSQVSLPDDGMDLLLQAANLTESERAKLNRLILEAAFPKQCPKRKRQKALNMDGEFEEAGMLAGRFHGEREKPHPGMFVVLGVPERAPFAGEKFVEKWVEYKHEKLFGHPFRGEATIEQLTVPISSQAELAEFEKFCEKY